MNSKNLIIGILALTTIIGGALAWQQYRKASDLDREVARLTKAAAERAERSPRRPSGERSQTAPAGQSSDAERPDGDRGPGRGDGPDRMGNMRTVLDSPEAARLMASQQRGMLDSRYAGLFKSLNLTPDQLAKFKDLLVEKQNATRDVMSVAREQGLDFRNNRDDIRQLIQQSNSDIDTSIIAAIGEDKFAQYQNYDQTGPQRAIASQLEQRLSYTAEPLTESQSAQLVALLAANSTASADSGPRTVVAAYVGGPGGGPPMMMGGGAQITNQVINAAQSFLSASQVDSLRQMQAQQNDQRQLQQLLNSSANPGGESGGGGQPRRTRGPRN